MIEPTLIRWAEHVVRMRQGRNFYKFIVLTPEEKGLVGKCKSK